MKQLFVCLVIAIALLSSCKKELKSISLSETEIFMHYEETHQLNVSYSPSDVDVPPVFSWSSDDSNIAEIDQNGNVEAIKVGETQVTVQTENGKFQASCNVIIEPISNLYEQPITEWGKSFNYVLENEKRTYIVETESAILYEGENSKVENVMYMFDYSGLNSVIVILKETEAVLDEASVYLEERFDLLTVLDSGIAYKVNNDVVAVLGYDNGLGLFVLYMENTLTKSSNLMSNQLRDLKNTYKILKKIN
ncbi:Ig-like domain-containing protein [Mariniphaga sediminis]|uniref:Ig-like domain-containing protein n=1 Tax=Mariniphaga sediminis TaxID=1628158 RepID=UPI00356AD969